MAATKRRNHSRKASDEKSLASPEKLGAKAYERELARLHGELVKLQLWVVAKGLKIVVVFEGRDGAGKGGVIKAITERVSPRVFRVVALPAPTEREKSQMYIQRYMRHLPAAGEIAIFDRSWYNRAGVERVMEFCSMEQVKRPMDLESYNRWYDYSRARDDMFKATDTPWAPWHVVRSNDKKRARLNTISHLLSQIPCEDLKREKPVLPKRQKPHGYVEPDYPYKVVPELVWPTS
jgi:polyphosphate kinase 2 (PPK2 family)